MDGERQTRSEMDYRDVEKLKGPKSDVRWTFKENRVNEGCQIHRGRQTRPVRDVRYTLKGRQGQEGMLDTPRKADKARDGC